MTSSPNLRITRAATWVTLAGATALLAARAGAPGWRDAGDAAAAAVALDVAPPAAAGPVLLGKLASLVPLGDLGFRVAALSIVAAVVALAGVVALARALVPDEPLAGPVAAAVLALSPALTAAGGQAGGAAFAAAVVVWGVVLAVRARRAAAAASRARRLATAAVLAVTLPLWWPAPASLIDGLDLAAWPVRLGHVVAALGDGAGAPLVLIGLVGLGFATLTGLRGAGLVLAAAGLAIAAAALGPAHQAHAHAAPALCLLAVGAAVVAGAVARVLGRQPSPHQRLAISGAVCAPLAALAALGPSSGRVDLGGDTPARAAAAVTAALPPGPGLVVLASPELYAAARAERVLAGARPDLTITPYAAGADEAVVTALRAGYTVGSDRAAFDRLDPRLARPAGRGFALELAAPELTWATPDPARWPGPIGARLAEDLALERATYEAVHARLDEAARAAGLVAAGRFAAGDLALLAGAVPTRARPPLYAFVPALGGDRVGWRPAVLGDDLAWVAGLPAAPVPPGAPERRLHALWREVLGGTLPADDASVRALGPAAVEATTRMLDAVRPPVRPPAPDGR